MRKKSKLSWMTEITHTHTQGHTSLSPSLSLLVSHLFFSLSLYFVIKLDQPNKDILFCPRDFLVGVSGHVWYKNIFIFFLEIMSFCRGIGRRWRRRRRTRRRRTERKGNRKSLPSCRQQLWKWPKIQAPCIELLIDSQWKTLCYCPAMIDC